MQRSLFLFLLVALTALFLWMRFPDFFTHGNTRFIEPWGDGYKSYHAVFFHIDHDSTLSHFMGMNYPYGEHAVPRDCEPFFCNSFKLLKSLGIGLSA